MVGVKRVAEDLTVRTAVHDGRQAALRGGGATSIAGEGFEERHEILLGRVLLQALNVKKKLLNVS